MIVSSSFHSVFVEVVCFVVSSVVSVVVFFYFPLSVCGKPFHLDVAIVDNNITISPISSTQIDGSRPAPIV